MHGGRTVSEHMSSIPRAIEESNRGINIGFSMLNHIITMSNLEISGWPTSDMPRFELNLSMFFNLLYTF